MVTGRTVAKKCEHFLDAVVISTVCGPGKRLKK